MSRLVRKAELLRELCKPHLPNEPSLTEQTKREVRIALGALPSMLRGVNELEQMGQEREEWASLEQELKAAPTMQGGQDEPGATDGDDDNAAEMVEARWDERVRVVAEELLADLEQLERRALATRREQLGLLRCLKEKVRVVQEALRTTEDDPISVALRNCVHRRELEDGSVALVLDLEWVPLQESLRVADASPLTARKVREWAERVEPGKGHEELGVEGRGGVQVVLAGGCGLYDERARVLLGGAQGVVDALTRAFTGEDDKGKLAVCVSTKDAALRARAEAVQAAGRRSGQGRRRQARVAKAMEWLELGVRARKSQVAREVTRNDPEKQRFEEAYENAVKSQVQWKCVLRVLEHLEEEAQRARASGDAEAAMRVAQRVAQLPLANAWIRDQVADMNSVEAHAGSGDVTQGALRVVSLGGDDGGGGASGDGASGGDDDGPDDGSPAVGGVSREAFDAWKRRLQLYVTREAGVGDSFKRMVLVADGAADTVATLFGSSCEKVEVGALRDRCSGKSFANSLVVELDKLAKGEAPHDVLWSAFAPACSMSMFHASMEPFVKTNENLSSGGVKRGKQNERGASRDSPMSTKSADGKDESDEEEAEDEDDEAKIADDSDDSDDSSSSRLEDESQDGGCSDDSERPMAATKNAIFFGLFYMVAGEAQPRLLWPQCLSPRLSGRPKRTDGGGTAYKFLRSCGPSCSGRPSTYALDVLGACPRPCSEVNMLYMLHACREGVQKALLQAECEHDVCDVFLVVLSQREACEQCARVLNAVHVYLSALWLGRAVRVRFAAWVPHDKAVKVKRLVCECVPSGELKHSVEYESSVDSGAGGGGADGGSIGRLEWKCEWFVPESQVRG